jgi:general nucleoside transport system ATP-binding protein
VLAAAAITRRFGRTLALDAVDFRAYPGEIHALVGENGAGKSTLINIFAGRLKPDRGVVSLDGVPLVSGSAHLALRAGIAAVYQSPMLFERMSWEENLALGGAGAGAAGKDRAVAAERVGVLAAELGFTLPATGAPVERCSVGERVRLEILRALSFEPRVLILDEPTGVLAPAELEAFLETLRRLRAEGRMVVMVTHKLAEALAVADRITVLRHGRVAAVRMAAETSAGELARLMIGEVGVFAVNSGTSLNRGAAPLAEAGASALVVEADVPALVMEDLTLDDRGRRLLDRIGLRLAAGEIAGVAGVDGNGQAELIEVMAGVRKPTAGTLRTAGHGGGVAVIAQNRDLDGLILDMTLWENLLLDGGVRRRFVRSGWLERARAMEFCAGVLERFRIRAAGVESPAAALSGGNRQRLAVARALAGEPRVLVVHDVCRGLDLRATAEVHRMLREFAAAGGAVLLISSDLDELLALSTSLYVIARGRLTAAAGERDAERIGLLMSGAAKL